MASRSSDDGDTEMSGKGAKRVAHEQARARDSLNKHFNQAESLDVVIETPPEQNGGHEAIAKVSRGEARDVPVFIDPGPHTLHYGDHVRCRLKYVGDHELKAIATFRLE